MAQSKPMGISKEQYKDYQEEASKNDFVYEVNVKLQDLKFAIDEVNKKLAESVASHGSNRVSITKQLSVVTTECGIKLKQFGYMMNDFQKQLSCLQEAVNLIHKNTPNFVKKDELNIEVEELLKTLKIFREDQRKAQEELTVHLNRQSREFDAKISALRQEMLNRPSEIPALRKELETKIELTELNGQNAVLRSSNNERQLFLLEKRIEQLALLHKKLEFERQG